MSNGILVALDGGHGMDTAGKRTPTLPDGSFMHENEFNDAVVGLLKIELERCGFGVLLVAPEEIDTPLSVRVQRANDANATFYLSVHANAYDTKFDGDALDPSGVETYTWTSGESLRIGTILHNHLIQGTPQKNRGVKDGTWLYVLANTKMPAVLVECAFMDNLREASLLRSEEFRKEVARELAQGLCEAYNVTYVPYTPPAPVNVPDFYTIVLNDSLSKISSKFGVSIDNIKLYNNLTSDALYVGQILRMKPYDQFDVLINDNAFKAIYINIDGTDHTFIEHSCVKSIPQVTGWTVDGDKFIVNYVPVTAIKHFNKAWLKWDEIVGDKLTATWLGGDYKFSFSSFHDYVVLGDRDDIEAIKVDNQLVDDALKIGQVLKIRN